MEGKDWFLLFVFLLFAGLVALVIIWIIRFFKWLGKKLNPQDEAEFKDEARPQNKPKKSTSSYLKTENGYQIERFPDGHEISYKIMADINRHLMLDYADADGNISKREVTTIQVQTRERAWYLYANCHLRNEPRHFRISRIKCLVDLDSGEVVDKRLVEFFQQSIHEDNTYE